VKILVIAAVVFLVSLVFAVALGRASKRADKVTQQYFTESSGPDGGDS
jgi:hypothetical protein